MRLSVRLLVVFLISGVWLSAQEPAGRPGPNGWTNIALDDARRHLSALSAEEQTEQLIDLAFLAAYLRAEEPARRAEGLTLFQPLRMDILAPLHRNRVGPTRWMTLSSGQLLALIPENVSNLPLEAGRLADEYRMAQGQYATSGCVPLRDGRRQIGLAHSARPDLHRRGVVHNGGGVS